MRIRRIRLVALLAAVAAIAAARSHELPASSSSTASPIVLPGEQRSDRHGPLGEADGAIPDGTTVFDNDVPGVVNLDPALLRSLRRAAAEAQADGVVFLVDSGWRSSDYQEHLLREAIAKYGSATEAARWVASPNTSAHVKGDAVDIGHADAATWLSEHGAGYGLCRVYANEPWHFELRPEAATEGCPPVYADPTQDPRMRR
jgi:hypothetical protein